MHVMVSTKKGFSLASLILLIFLSIVKRHQLLNLVFNSDTSTVANTSASIRVLISL